MPKVDEVIERLRGWRDWHDNPVKLHHEAADLLAAMKEALEEIAEDFDDLPSNSASYLSLAIEQRDIARNALNGENNG